MADAFAYKFGETAQPTPVGPSQSYLRGVAGSYEEEEEDYF
jgi:hypothetical protein